MSQVAVTPVNIWKFDGKSTLQTTPFQLLQWKHGLRLETKGLTMSRGRKVSTHLRKVLGTPRAYPAADLLQHVTDSLDDINKQLGVTA